MRATTVGIFLSAMTLGACATAPMVTRDAQPVPIGVVQTAATVHSAYDNIWAETPFQRGAMSIVTTEHGDLRSYRLVPCHNGIVCSGSARGRHGHVAMQGDVMVVSGLYGRTFYLEQGGDGHLIHHGRKEALAWDSDVVLVGGD